MKKLLLFLFVSVLVFVTNAVKSQENYTDDKIKISTAFNPNFSKGKNQVAIEGLSFGWGYGRIIGSIGARYGYFIANNNMLFINGEFSTYGSGYKRYKAGLNYRRYFNINENISPYAQIGFGGGFEDFYNNKNTTFGEVSLGGGLNFQIKKFGFELGMQVDIWDKVNFKPTVGVSYTF